MAQPGLLALAAFLAEIGRIPATVSEPMLGEIRLQWWRDTIAAVARGGISGHPVADAFGAAIRRHDLDLSLLHRVIDARGFDFTGDLYPDEAALGLGMAGSEGVAKLRAAIQIGPEKVRFVACSVEHSPAWSEARKAEGYDSTLGKPFNKDHLLDTLAAVGK